MERTENIDLGIELSFLDKREGCLKITSRLFSANERERLAYTLNGSELVCSLGEYTKINDTYRYIFEIKLEYPLINKEHSLSFKEPIRTGYYFPLESSLNGYYMLDSHIVYCRDNDLVFSPYEKKLLKDLKKKYRRAVLKPNKTALIALAIRILNRMLKPFYKKELWLISDRIDKAGDNGESFFKYAVSHAPGNVKCVFLLDKKSGDYKRIKKIGKVKSPASPFYKVYYTLASKHISSQLDGSRLLSVRAYLKDILREQKTVFLQHGVTKDDISSYYNRFDFGIDMISCATKDEYSSIVSNKNYGFDREIAKGCGFARYDSLTSEREKIIFIAPTWRLFLLKDTEGCELVDDFKQSKYYNFYNGLLHSEELISLAKEKGYSLCFYPHAMMKNASEYFKSLDHVFIEPTQFSYNEMFKRGAMLLTDYSSVQFDFAYLKKPLIYCHFDRDELNASHTYKAGYFEYERDGFGPVTYDLDGAINTLCEYIGKDCALEDKYRERIDNTFLHSDKNNCERTLKDILSLK